IWPGGPETSALLLAVLRRGGRGRSRGGPGGGGRGRSGGPRRRRRRGGAIQERGRIVRPAPRALVEGAGEAAHLAAPAVVQRRPPQQNLDQGDPGDVGRIRRVGRGPAPGREAAG